MTRRPGKDQEAQRGQGLVEFALMLPIMLLLIASVAELGVIFGNSQALVYGSREGARVGSALAKGESALCTGTERDPSGVDGQLVAAVQRILKSPDSGIKLNKVSQIRIFKATPTGTETTPLIEGDFESVWTYTPLGHDIDPGNVTELVNFEPAILASTWRPCDRLNSGNPPDSIGVSIVYTYDFVMPVASVVNAVAGGRLQMTLKETTVMALNPTI